MIQQFCRKAWVRHRGRRCQRHAKETCLALASAPLFLSETTMPGLRLPQEITDLIVDLLHNEPRTLKQCCIVSKSWIPRARRHLFRWIEFDCPAQVDAWKATFPDLANSPGHHARSLSVSCLEVFTIADAGEGSWIQAFSNVVQLRVLDSGTRNFRLHSTALESFE